jgi:hypothetical protein
VHIHNLIDVGSYNIYIYLLSPRSFPNSSWINKLPSFSTKQKRNQYSIFIGALYKLSVTNHDFAVSLSKVYVYTITKTCLFLPFVSCPFIFQRCDSFCIDWINKLHFMLAFFSFISLIKEWIYFFVWWWSIRKKKWQRTASS